MALNYNILWVDDVLTPITKQNGLCDKLNKFIKDELYFNSTINTFESPKHALEKLKSKNKKYDVIFTDYNLIGGMNGNDFINEVRNNNFQCEILFYTQMKKNLEDMIKSLIVPNSESINRISFCTLPEENKSDFILTLKDFVRSSVEKFNTLPATRSIIISETGDLDNKMIDIIKQYYSVNFDSKKDSFITNIISGKEKDLKGKLVCEYDNKSCICIWRGSREIDKIVNDFNFGSRMIAKTISLIMKEIGFTYESDYVDDYNNEIIDKRNIFAHCSAEYKDGKEFPFNPRTKKSIYFDKGKISDIRKSIIHFNEVLDNLLDFLKLK